MSNRLAIAALMAAGYQMLAASLLGAFVLVWLAPSLAASAPEAANWANMLLMSHGANLPFGLRIGLADMLIATGLITTMQARVQEGAHELRERAARQEPDAQKLFVREMMVLAGLGAFCSFLMVFHRPPDLLLGLAGAHGATGPTPFLQVGWDGLFSVAYTFFGIITRAAIVSGESLDI